MEHSVLSDGLGRSMLMNHGEFPLEEEFLIVPPPRFAAGGLLETSGLHEYHGLHRQAVALGDGALDGLYGRGPERIHRFRSRSLGLRIGRNPAFIHFHNNNKLFKRR